MRSTSRLAAAAFLLQSLLLTGVTKATPITRDLTDDTTESSFCDAFVKQCYLSAVEGQSGDVTVSHSCGRNGGSSYTYTCQRDNKTLTTKVLKALGPGYATPRSVTKARSTSDPVPTITQTVFSNIGYAHGIDIESGDDIGALGQDNEYPNSIFMVEQGVDKGQPMQLMAVRDAASGMYKLVPLAWPLIALISFDYSGDIFSPGSNASSPLYLEDPSQCGAAANGPAPVTPNSLTPCEVYMFSPIGDTTADTIDFEPLWVNPDGATPANNTGAWGASAHTGEGFRPVIQVADIESFTWAYPGSNYTWFNLSFPYDAPY